MYTYCTAVCGVVSPLYSSQEQGGGKCGHGCRGSQGILIFNVSHAKTGITKKIWATAACSALCRGAFFKLRKSHPCFDAYTFFFIPSQQCPFSRGNMAVKIQVHIIMSTIESKILSKHRASLRNNVYISISQLFSVKPSQDEKNHSVKQLTHVNLAEIF